MKILLVGEYSRLHLSLAEGLRVLGHEVTLASDGDSFKNYERDIDLTRKSSSIKDSLSALLSIRKKVLAFKGYDVVQIINPCFTTLNVHVNRYLFRKLKKNNKKIFLGAFGDDSYWVRACMDNKTFKYSEFFVNGKSTNLNYNRILKNTWINSAREKANREMAEACNGIIACLYEYYESYKADFSDKLVYIPLPINIDKIKFSLNPVKDKLSFFIGINKDRSEYKGTDIMYRALRKAHLERLSESTVLKAESMSYAEYKQMMADAHVVLDQLYSHSPSMNALLAMAKGKVLVGGGEAEIYEQLNETLNHPIVNVFPSQQGVKSKLLELIDKKDEIPQLALSSRKFVEDHHNYIEIAQRYIDFWTKNKES